MTESYHHGNLRAELIAGGITMLNRDGIAAFSLRRLSQELGVSHTAAYRHFSSKEDLFRAIFSEVSRNFRDALVNAVSSAGAEGTAGGKPGVPANQSALIGLGIGYVRFFRDHPEYAPLFSLMHSENPFIEGLFQEKPRESGMPPGDQSRFSQDQGEAFSVFQTLVGAVRGLDEYKNLEEYEVLLGFWAKVHGLALLIVAHPLMIPPERFEESLERIMQTRF